MAHGSLLHHLMKLLGNILKGYGSHSSHLQQAAEKRPPASLPSSFVVAEVQKTFGPSSDKNFTAGAAQGFILLRISGALHLDIFDQPYKSVLFQHTYKKPLWNHNAIIFCLSQAEA
jgi:hypothetical protein